MWGLSRCLLWFCISKCCAFTACLGKIQCREVGRCWTQSEVQVQAYAHDVAAEGASTAGVELRSRGMSMSFLTQQVWSHSPALFSCTGLAGLQQLYSASQPA